MPYEEPKRSGSQTPDYSKLAVSDDSGIGWVLFIGNDDETEIKIGYGSKLKRYKDYVKEDVFGTSEVHLLAAVRGTEADEKAIHRYFAEENIGLGRRKKEFFRASERLVDYLAHLRSYHFVCTSIADERNPDKTKAFDSSIWLPTDSRRRSERVLDLLSGASPWGWLPGREDSSGDEYFTLKDLVEPARMVLGAFDLDPASQTEVNESIIKAATYYTKATSGLERPWFGRVWLNPPFTLWPEFVGKTVSELERGEITGMILLANTRAITAQYFKPLLRQSAGICILHGRYSFWGILHSEDGSPSNGQIMVLVKGDYQKFRKAYGDIGACFQV